MITWFNCNWLQLTAINCNQLQCHCKPLQLIAIDCNETQYGEKATYFQHSPLNSRTLVNHEPTMTTASPNIHQTAAVVSNWQALLVLFEIERKKSVKTQRETKLSPASWLERKVASKCGRGQICFVKGGRKCKNLNFAISLLISCTSQCRVSLSLWSRGQRISLSRAQFTSSFFIYFSVVLVLLWRLIKWVATVPEHELRIMETDDT